ncbi:UNVERIFIED_CONTAM: Kinesin-like protein KIN-14S [Sesamum latifolium]|uniref:Kinesin-like protein KIN-14S n=1 Tax=Sesamum latifolium TaxID=2727402 RepID=A0AAW2XB18_9LAMI
MITETRVLQSVIRREVVVQRKVRDKAVGTEEVPGLVEAHVYGADEIWGLLSLGSRVRFVGSTNANELSSCSYCLLHLTIMGENLVSGQRTRS